MVRKKGWKDEVKVTLVKGIRKRKKKSMARAND